MAMAMSKPTANGSEPSPARDHNADRSALLSKFQVSQRHAPSNSQMPHLRRICRTNVNGPLTASAVAMAPKISVQSSGLAHRLDSENAPAPSRLAASRMTMISNEPQPTSCSRLRIAGTPAPLVPRLSLSAAIDDSPVSLPITPTAASNRTPTSVPRKIASMEPDMPNPGASNAPVCRTIKPMPKENHNANKSRPPKTRLPAGTGMTGE